MIYSRCHRSCTSILMLVGYIGPDSLISLHIVMRHKTLAAVMRADNSTLMFVKRRINVMYSRRHRSFRSIL